MEATLLPPPAEECVLIESTQEERQSREFLEALLKQAEAIKAGAAIEWVI